MIKPQDLRIGNTVGVYTGDEWAKYKEIIDHEDLAENSCAEYYPIELSAEILGKAGFACRDYGIRKKYSIGYFQISLYPNGDVIFLWSGEVVYIKSVHQLQNLIFALTGEELPVELY